MRGAATRSAKRLPRGRVGRRKPPKPKHRPVSLRTPPVVTSGVVTLTTTGSRVIPIERAAVKPDDIPRPRIDKPVRRASLRYASMVDDWGDDYNTELVALNEFGQPPNASRRRVLRVVPETYEPPPGWSFKIPPRIHRRKSRRVRTAGLKPCLCGCGAPCIDYFAQGHYARWHQLMRRFAEGELLPHRVLPANLFERLGPWVATEEGGMKPTKTYKALRH